LTPRSTLFDPQLSTHLSRRTLLKRTAGASLLLVPALAALAGCGGSDDEKQNTSSRNYPLSELPRTNVTVRGKTFNCWIADTDGERGEGLMYVQEFEIGRDRGMLFVYNDSRIRGYFGKNVFIPLDLVYMDANKRIVRIARIEPQNTELIGSGEPARYVLETLAGVMESIGAQVGDVVQFADLTAPIDDDD
jgi:uncharacterized protein